MPRPRLILGIALVSALISCVLAAMRLDVQTDQLELISEHHPLIALNEKLEPFNFEGKTMFTVVVEAQNPEQAVSFSNGLADRIRGNPDYFRDVLYRVDPQLFKRWALLYLDKEDLVRIRENVEEHDKLIRGLAKDPDLLNFLRLLNRDMASRMVGELFTGFLDEGTSREGSGSTKDPMDLGFLIKSLEGLRGYLDSTRKYGSPWSSFFKSVSWDLEQEGYFWEGSKRYLILLVVPRKIGDDLNNTQKSLDRLRELTRDLQASFPGLQAGVTGQEALNNDEMNTAMGDMARATWLSLLGVLVLMILFFRGLRRPFIEMIALGIGLCWTLGWTTLFIGHLNILSVVFAPLLCGLGVDYGIHWFARYEEEERGDGLDRRALIRRVTDRSGPGIILAGLSGAFSFLPLVLTGFRGLMELGLITGAGILLILLADFTVLPALAVYMAGSPRRKENGEASLRNGNLLRFKPSSARLMLAAVALSCALGLWAATRVHFDLNPLRLQAASAESVIWERRLIENSQLSVLSASVFAASPEEVDSKTKALMAQPSISEVKSVYSLLPERQDEKLPILQSLSPLIPEMVATDPDRRDRVADTEEFISLLERIRFKLQEDQAAKWGAEKPLVEQMGRVRSLAGDCIRALREDPARWSGLTDFRKLFQKDLIDTWTFLKEGATASIMTIDDLPPVLKNQFYRDGHFLLRIFPRGTIWEEDALTRFVQDIQKVDPNVVGDPVSLYTFAAAFKRACILAAVYALVAITILLLLNFRDLRLVLVALAPLGVGTIWTVAVMGLTEVDFNLANSMFMPLIVGAGVEYGVIILQRWREGRMEPGQLPSSTGKGVILAALTTTVGFGTLMISNHRGIFSLGFVAWVGSLCVLATAIVIVPAILAGFKSPGTNVK